MAGVKLTAKQQSFVDEYLIDMNATQAAIRAGYSQKTAAQIGDENLRKPVIADAIANALKDRAEKVQIDAEWVLNNAVRVFERCMQNEPVKYQNGDPVYVGTPNGDLAPAYKFEHAGANKALEIIGKHIDVQAFKDRLEHSGGTQNVTTIEYVIKDPSD